MYYFRALIPIRAFFMSDLQGHIPSGERRAWLILTGVFLLVAAIHAFFYVPQKSEPLSKQDLMLIDSLNNSGQNKISTSYFREDLASFSLKPKLFNPNSVTRDEMQQMGFPEKLVNGLLGYREKVGPFRTKEDFARIYTLSPALKDKLLPFVELPEAMNHPKNVEQKDNHSLETGARKIKIIELNSCDSSELIQLRGIGPYYARIILKYRESLGGYLTPDQLLEIRRLPDSVYQQISQHLTTNPSLIRRIHINQLDESSLSKHPYINMKQARAIVNYRSQHGPFQSGHDLKKIILLDESFIRKITPYIRYD